MARGELREAHIPTQQSSPCQEARLPPPHEHPGRPGSVEVASRQGSPQSLGLIWRIRERSAFTRIASKGGALGPECCGAPTSSILQAPSHPRVWRTPWSRARSRRRTQPCSPAAAGHAAAASSEAGLPAGIVPVRRAARCRRTVVRRTAVRSGADTRSHSRLIRLVIAYQRAMEGRPSPCRFTPSCSSYAMRGAAGAWHCRGSWLTIRRLAALPPVRAFRLGPGAVTPDHRPMLLLTHQSRHAHDVSSRQGSARMIAIKFFEQPAQAAGLVLQLHPQLHPGHLADCPRGHAGHGSPGAEEHQGHAGDAEAAAADEEAAGRSTATIARSSTKR